MANILYLSLILIIQIFHPIHVSVTEIEHDEASKSLEMVMRIFIDDLELAIRNELKEPALDITNPGKNRDTDVLLEKYLRKHFKIDVNGKSQEYSYLGHEVELPVIYLYVEAKNVKKVKEIGIHNAIIMEAYDDQANLVHVDANGETKSMKLVDDKRKSVITF